ncbi:hypothetical protein RI129_007100 [Pyrocoelia pectoralis]|uniref:Uncharacterized protein n=1 Tax=Pyrocoelia pectoralis TaxID=417401 RepID=A0AAN7V7C7_9COLE
MDLGMSTRTTVTDDECCVTSFDFIIECDIDSAKRWATMHLFYSCIGNSEGADLCLEMAHKYLNTEKSTDYIANHDKLVWTTSICPNQIFFRSAELLIKMHLYEFAEKSLTRAKDANLGVYHYLLGVIQYYRQNYQHALIHVKEAKELHGPDYAVNSLMGHCYLALEKLENAKREYMRVLESFNRPDDIHLVYVYLALISERTGNKHFAKNMLLSACKYSPTPYTWLGAGLIYYAQKDLISAEQCLLQANVCDNRLAEVWGYLALINLELTRYSEAELCYKQTKKVKFFHLYLHHFHVNMLSRTNLKMKISPRKLKKLGNG